MANESLPIDDEYIIKALGLGEFIGVFDHSGALDNFVQYHEIFVGMIMGWSHVDDIEETKKKASNLYISMFYKATTTEIDVLLPLICVSRDQKIYK